MDFNIGSVLNGAFIFQVNYLVANNTANNSPGARMSINQTASNTAHVTQTG